MNKDLPEVVQYQGYEIRPNPMKVIVKNAERWNTHFEIWEHRGSESTVVPFYGKPTYELKEDAIKHCFRAGKYIIDNEPEKLAEK